MGKWNVPVQSLIDHIKTAVDVDPWAKEMVEELLKEQEAVEPYMDYDGKDVWRCGKYGNSLMYPSYYESDKDAKNHIRYCSHCGQAVKWDE